MPTEIIGKWTELKLYDRLMATELFRLIGDEPTALGSRWEERLLNRLALRKDERRAAKASIARLIEAGVLTVADGTVQVLLEYATYEQSRRAYINRLAILERDGWACAYCEAPLDKANAHVDHVMPFARGGSDDPTNLVAACARCNMSKGAKTVEEWRS